MCAFPPAAQGHSQELLSELHTAELLVRKGITLNELYTYVRGSIGRFLRSPPKRSKFLASCNTPQGRTGRGNPASRPSIPLCPSPLYSPNSG